MAWGSKFGWARAASAFSVGTDHKEAVGMMDKKGYRNYGPKRENSNNWWMEQNEQNLEHYFGSI